MDGISMQKENAKTVETHETLLDRSARRSDVPKSTFDSMLNRIGLGKFQWKAWMIFGFLGMADGSESMVLSFTIPIFNKVFDPSFDLEGTLGTCVYFGYLIGSLCSGFLADKYGRRKPVVYATFFMIVFCLLSAFPPSIPMFIVYRSIFGMIDGIFSPMAYTYLAEVTPAKNRGKFMTILGVNYTIGELIACCIAIVTLENINSGDWHALLAWSTFPALIAWISSYFFLDESPRYQMVKGEYELGLNTMKKMCLENKKSDYLMTAEEEKQIIMTYENTRLKREQSNEKQEVGSVRDLFTAKYARITIPVWFNWFTNALTYNGVTYILPTILSELNQGGGNNDNDYTVSSIIFSCLLELPNVFVAAAIVDSKYFGRKNSMAISFLCGGFCCLMASLQVAPGIIFWISITKFFFILAWTLNFQFTCELYPTKIRGTGIGLASSFGRVGSIIMAPMCAYMNGMGPLVPFLFFGVVSTISGFLTLTLPYDTVGLEMDSLDHA
jgi:MFS family permease